MCVRDGGESIRGPAFYGTVRHFVENLCYKAMKFSGVDRKKG